MKYVLLLVALMHCVPYVRASLRARHLPSSIGCSMPYYGLHVAKGTCPITGSNLQSGTSHSCDVSCETGYTKTGTGTGAYSCSNGVLTQSPLTCTASTCKLPDSYGLNVVPGTCPSAGDPIQSGTTHSCKVECASGYSPDSGTGVYSCLNGAITKSPLTCTATPCPLSSFSTNVDPDGCTAYGSSLPSGDSCTVKCDTGYTGTGTATYSCDHGTLTPSASAALTCTATPCPLSSFGSNVDSNGCAVYGSSLPSGDSCTVKCDTGYTGTGTAIYSCDHGTLTPSPSAAFTCTPSPCPLPPASAYGSHVAKGTCAAYGSSLPSGDSCDVSCDTVSVVESGTTTYSCTNGVMTPASLKCTQSCTLPPSYNSPAGTGVDKGSCPTPASDNSLSTTKSCTVRCDNGFDSTGSGIYSCSDGVLTPSTLTCTASRCAALPTFESNIEGKNGDDPACIIDQALNSGAKCDVACKTKFVGDGGSASYMCLNGKLTDATLKCAAASCTFSPNFNRNVNQGTCATGALGSGDKCDISCNTGFTGNGGSNEYSCTEGTLTPSTLTLSCSASPCKLPAFYGTDVESDSCPVAAADNVLNSDEECTVKCKTGFDEYGHTEYMCKNGKLTIPSISCSAASCTLPHEFNQFVRPGACVPGGELISGKSCDLNGCRDGYLPSENDATYNCVEGQVSGGLTCTSPPTPAPAPIEFSTILWISLLSICCIGVGLFAYKNAPPNGYFRAFTSRGSYVQMSEPLAPNGTRNATTTRRTTTRTNYPVRRTGRTAASKTSRPGRSTGETKETKVKIPTYKHTLADLKKLRDAHTEGVVMWHFRYDQHTPIRNQLMKEFSSTTKEKDIGRCLNLVETHLVFNFDIKSMDKLDLEHPGRTRECVKCAVNIDSPSRERVGIQKMALKYYKNENSTIENDAKITKMKLKMRGDVTMKQLLKEYYIMPRSKDMIDIKRDGRREWDCGCTVERVDSSPNGKIRVLKVRGITQSTLTYKFNKNRMEGTYGIRWRYSGCRALDVMSPVTYSNIPNPTIKMPDMYILHDARSKHNNGLLYFVETLESENHSKKFMNFGNSTTFEVPMHVTGVQPLATHTSAFLKFCKEYYKIGFSNLHGWATVDARSERNCVEEYMLIDPDCVSLIEPTLTENETVSNVEYEEKIRLWNQYYLGVVKEAKREDATGDDPE